jgi:protein-tyrosine phosphatase
MMEDWSSSLDGFKRDLGTSSYEIETRNDHIGNDNQGLCVLKQQPTTNLKSVDKIHWDTTIGGGAMTEQKVEYRGSSLLSADGVRLSCLSPRTSCLSEKHSSCLSPDPMTWLSDNHLGGGMKRQETLLVVEEMIGDDVDHVVITADEEEEESIERQRRELGMIYRNPQLRTQSLMLDMDDTGMIARTDIGLATQKPQLKLLIPSETTISQTTVWPVTHEKTDLQKAHGSSIRIGSDDRSTMGRDGGSLLLCGSVDGGGIESDSHGNYGGNGTRMIAAGHAHNLMASYSFTMIEGHSTSGPYGESMMEGRTDGRTSIHRSSGPRMIRSQSMIVHKGRGESRENPHDTAGNDGDRGGGYRGSSSWFRTTRGEMHHWLPPPSPSPPRNQVYHRDSTDGQSSWGQQHPLAYASLPDRCMPSGHGAYPALILPYLYLGNDEHASNVQVLKHLAITYIVNCAVECDNHFEHVADVSLVYLNVRLKHDSENIQEFFESIFEFVDKARDEKRAVLIHCFFGQSRSAVIVVAYLMKKLRLDFHRAYELVRMACPCINPHHILLFQLSEFEKSLVNTTCSPASSSPSLSCPSSTSLLNSDSR